MTRRIPPDLYTDDAEDYGGGYSFDALPDRDISDAGTDDYDEAMERVIRKMVAEGWTKV